jgi:hypothetical protein
MTGLSTENAPDAVRPKRNRHVLAWITLGVSGVLGAVCWVLAVGIYVFATGASGPKTDDGLIYFLAIIVVGTAAIVLTALAMVALSIITGKRWWMIVGIVFGALGILVVWGGPLLFAAM